MRSSSLLVSLLPLLDTAPSVYVYCMLYIAAVSVLLLLFLLLLFLLLLLSLELRATVHCNRWDEDVEVRTVSAWERVVAVIFFLQSLCAV